MINHPLDVEQLDRTVVDYCNRVAQVPLDLLTVHKHTTKCWFQLAGLCTAAYESADFDAIAHESLTRTDWHKIPQAEGYSRPSPGATGPSAMAGARNASVRFNGLPKAPAPLRSSFQA